MKTKIVDLLKDMKPTEYYANPADETTLSSRRVYDCYEADEYIETLESYVDELETENEALKKMINRIPDDYLSKKDNSFGTHFVRSGLKLIGIVAATLAIAVCVTGCCSNLHKTDDGMYYCVTDGKYYSEMTKAFCE